MTEEQYNKANTLKWKLRDVEIARKTAEELKESVLDRTRQQFFQIDVGSLVNGFGKDYIINVIDWLLESQKSFLSENYLFSFFFVIFRV